MNEVIRNRGTFQSKYDEAKYMKQTKMDSLRRCTLYLIGLTLIANGCTADDCPLKCVCQQRIAVHCAGKGLVKIPRRLPSGTVQLMAENNAIQELPIRMLRNAEYLHTLVLHGNQITSLTERNFRTTPQLSYLDLSHNNITYIPANAFDGLGDLHMLSLSMNDISRLSPQAFADLLTLRDLFLSENNIRALPLALFSKLENLQNLHLDGNSISTIPDGLFRGLTSLVSLDLSRNRIRRIAIGTTSGLSALQHLLLHSNQIAEIDGHLAALENACTEGVGKSSNSEVIHQSKEDGVLTNSRQLQTIDLRYNSLRTIRLSSFVHLTHLRNLRLGENRWRCDCALKKTILSLRTQLGNQNLAWGDIHCAEPDTIKNINIDDLTLRDIESVTPKTTTPSTTVSRNVYGWNNRNAVEKNAVEKWHREDVHSHAESDRPEIPQEPKINPEHGGAEDMWTTTSGLVLTAAAAGGKEGEVDSRTLSDPAKAAHDTEPRKEINATLPPSWSLSRIIGRGVMHTIASDTPRYHGNAGDDVRTRLFVGFPTLPNNRVEQRSGGGAVITVETAEDNGRNLRKGNDTRDTILRGFTGERGREADDPPPDGTGAGDDGVLAKESPSRKERATDTWMLALVVVLSVFAVIACAGLTVQKHYQRNNKEWRCCFKKDNFHTSASIRSVTTYPLLYDNALARRPLPRAPSFALNERAERREDVRWTNGGMYGLGSNRSSFISVQSSHTNLSNIGLGRPTVSQVDLNGSRVPLLPPSQSLAVPAPGSRRNSRDITVFPKSRDSVPLPTRRGWTKDLDNFTLVPTRERQSIQRSQSTAVPTNGRARQQPSRTGSDRSDWQRRTPDERQKQRRRRRSGRRPESAIIVPRLHDVGLSPLAEDLVSRAGEQQSTAERKLRRHKSECRPSEKKSPGLQEITELTEERRPSTTANSLVTAISRKTKNDSELKPAFDVLQRLDGILAEHLARSTSADTSVASSRSRNPSSNAVDAKLSLNRVGEAAQFRTGLDYSENNNKASEQQQASRNGSQPNASPTRRSYNLAISNQQSKLHVPNGKVSPSVSYKNGGYDVLLLCTSGEKLPSQSNKSAFVPPAQKNPVTVPASPSRQKNVGDSLEKKDAPLQRKESVESVFVDGESICESSVTGDSGSCFGDGEADFEIVYPTIDCYRTCPGDVYGSDQYILDSLRNQSKLLRRPLNHTSPAALEHLTVPMSELSSEEEDSFSTLQIQNTMSRSSSVGSIATVIDKASAPKAQNSDDFVYTMAEESPMETVPKIVINNDQDEETKMTSSDRNDVNDDAKSSSNTRNACNKRSTTQQESTQRSVRDRDVRPKVTSSSTRVDVTRSTKPTPGHRLEKIDPTEMHYHHIRDMYSGFRKRPPVTENHRLIDKSDCRNQNGVQSPIFPVQKSRRRPYCYIDVVDKKPSVATVNNPKECKESECKKKPRTEEQSKKEAKDKNIGYFESIESSDDEGSTDVEVIDLGTL